VQWDTRGFGAQSAGQVTDKSQAEREMDNLVLAIGAGCFGALIGWYVYYVNRYRKGDVQFSDITTLIGVLGGAAIPKIFTDNVLVFGAYGIGIFLGFFGYLLNLIILVKVSENFDVDWFLDGRRKLPENPYYIPGDVVGTVHPEMTLSRFRMPSAPNPMAARIIEVCEQEWPADKSDCSAFVRDVAGQFGVVLNGQADDIVDQIRAGWRRLADGPAAKRAADDGLLVVAGLKGSEQAEPAQHGHVVIVVSGPLAQGKYPSAYWGKLDGVGEKNKTINWAWRAGDRDRVTFAAVPGS
jgi:hypothetical protein